MTHYALLRHGFDIARKPDRLGGSHDDPFWLKLNHGHGHSSEKPTWLPGNVVWLVSWEGTMKMRHMLCGWFVVERVGKCNAVIATHTACGTEGSLFPYALGPLDQQPWFLKFVENHRKFRDGEPTDISENLDDLTAFVRNAGCTVPPAESLARQGSTAG
jgi:hypothetical protein